MREGGVRRAYLGLVTPPAALPLTPCPPDSAGARSPASWRRSGQPRAAGRAAARREPVHFSVPSTPWAMPMTTGTTPRQTKAGRRHNPSGAIASTPTR